MSDSTSQQDTIWEAVSQVCPRLRKHIRVYPQSFRGDRWYVLHDETSGKHVRLNAGAFALVGRFDGRRSLETIVDFLDSNESVDLNRQQVIDIVGQLQHLGALSGAMDRSTSKLIDSHYKNKAGTRLRKLLSPLMIRIPMLDPDKWLEAMGPVTTHLFKPIVGFIWTLVLMLGLITALSNTQEIGAEFTSEILKPTNLLLLWLLYPLLKTLHEFAHAVCVKHWGGEVHEMGITLLVLTPIPYVDASAASSFKSKYKRMLVSSSGILVELFLASLAIIFWASASDGFLRDVAFGVFTIGAISTVLFNANPLLKFDGYFVLQDLIEIPNLYTRSAAYYRYLFKTYCLKLPGQASPQSADGERKWFLVFGAASTIYRMIIMLVIVMFLINKYLILGVVLALWALVQQFVLPAFKFSRYLSTAPELDEKRSRVLGGVVASVAAAALILFAVPLPDSTRADGVVWVPEQGQLFSESGGFVSEVLVEPGTHVTRGEALLKLVNPELDRDLAALEAEVKVLSIETSRARETGAVDYALTRNDLLVKQAELDEEKRVKESRIVRAGSNGTFVVPQTSNLIGAHYSKGDLIGHIVDPSQLIVRVVVPEGQSGPMHQGIRKAGVRLAENMSRTIPATVQSETPSANNRLPSAALGAMGGGGIAVATSDPDGLTTVEKIFHLQLSLPKDTAVFGVGERAYVQLRHEAQPLGTRWYRSLQQLFLKNLPV